MDDSQIFIGNFEMLKALYDFKATFAKTLSFRENDLFILHQTNTKQRNWWQVINERGEIGFVPSNYVQKIKVNPSFLLQFLDDSIAYLQREKTSVGLDKEDLLARLNEKRRLAELNIKSIQKSECGGSSVSSNDELQNLSTSTEHPREVRSTTSFSTSTEDRSLPDLKYGRRNNDVEEEPIKPVHKQSPTNLIKHSIENIHQEVLKEQKSQIKSEYSSTKSSKTNIKVEIQPQHVYEMVEAVRSNTKLSHELSRVAVVTVISQLQEILPVSVQPHLSKILSHSQTSLVAGEQMIENTQDANRLRVIFKELTYCKEDSQQRSWMLYEDESVITEYISELISILSNADPNISRHVIANDQYHVIITLVQYYQMEARWSIRQLLLQAFGVMCSLDKTVVSIMLNSVLPMELARKAVVGSNGKLFISAFLYLEQMLAVIVVEAVQCIINEFSEMHKDMRTNPRNISKLNYSCLLLTMIFSMGEQMPVTHLEQLGYEFLVFILNSIESPPDTDIDEQIPDLFLNFILAFNLQFTTYTDNVLLMALAEQTSAKTFTEKILLLLNREEDPVRIFEHEPAPPHSLLKLFIDMFGKESTASLFYTNDVKVLIDIIVRQLSDLSPGDRKRIKYLELCRRVMKNTNYAEHRHRYADIHKCFTRILCEESDLSRYDQKLIREITNDFPHYFKM